MLVTLPLYNDREKRIGVYRDDRDTRLIMARLKLSVGCGILRARSLTDISLQARLSRVCKLSNGISRVVGANSQPLHIHNRLSYISMGPIKKSCAFNHLHEFCTERSVCIDRKVVFPLSAASRSREKRRCACDGMRPELGERAAEKIVDDRS